MRNWTRPDGRTFVFGEPDADLPAGELYTSVDEADAARRSALEALGFGVVRRELELLLPTRLPRAPVPDGFGLFRADEVSADALRALDDELRQDVPGTDGWHWPAAEFRAETYESPHFDPALYLVGAAPDEEPVAICRVWSRPDLPRLGFVGVRRAHRRRGVTRWLVGEAFAVLAARGRREVSTSVDETNVASRTLLERIGGRHVGATLELRRAG